MTRIAIRSCRYRIPNEKQINHLRRNTFYINQEKKNGLACARKRFYTALLQAKQYKNRTEDADYPVELAWRIPMEDKPGTIRISAYDLTFCSTEMLKAFLRADSMKIRCKSYPDEMGWPEAQPELVLTFLSKSSK